MADAADCSMPGAFAKDYLNRIMKKTEKKVIMCLIYVTHKRVLIFHI